MQIKGKVQLISSVKATIFGQMQNGVMHKMSFYYNYEEFYLEKKFSTTLKIIFIVFVTIFVIVTIIITILMAQTLLIIQTYFNWRMVVM